MLRGIQQLHLRQYQDELPDGGHDGDQDELPDGGHEAEDKNELPAGGHDGD